MRILSAKSPQRTFLWKLYPRRQKSWWRQKASYAGRIIHFYLLPPQLKIGNISHSIVESASFHIYSGSLAKNGLAFAQAYLFQRAGIENRSESGELDVEDLKSRELCDLSQSLPKCEHKREASQDFDESNSAIKR